MYILRFECDKPGSATGKFNVGNPQPAVLHYKKISLAENASRLDMYRHEGKPTIPQLGNIVVDRAFPLMRCWSIGDNLLTTSIEFRPKVEQAEVDERFQSFMGDAQWISSPPVQLVLDTPQVNAVIIKTNHWDTALMTLSWEQNRRFATAVHRLSITCRAIERIPIAGSE